MNGTLSANVDYRRPIAGQTDTPCGICGSAPLVLRCALRLALAELVAGQVLSPPWPDDALAALNCAACGAFVSWLA